MGKIGDSGNEVADGPASGVLADEETSEDNVRNSNEDFTNAEVLDPLDVRGSFLLVVEIVFFRVVNDYFLDNGVVNDNFFSDDDSGARDEDLGLRYGAVLVHI